MYEAAANPVRSPITPPPSANSVVPRSHLAARRKSKIRSSVTQFLCDSPSGNSKTRTSRATLASAEASLSA